MLTGKNIVLPEMALARNKGVSLQKFYDYCTEHQLAFVFYRLPGEKNINIICQHNSTLLKNEKQFGNIPGFVFAPFAASASCPKLLIRADYTFTEDTIGLPIFQNATTVVAKHLPSYSPTTKKEFLSLVQSIKEGITKNQLRKVVAARVRLVNKPSTFHPALFFKKLCHAYPAAFVSLVYTPATGTWVGATPEMLLSVNGNEYSTHSLAGTRYTKNGKWGKKEETEQQIVSDYIQTVFRKVTKVKPLVTGPETVLAGNLAHIRTTFTFRGIAPFNRQKVLALLHPTPAVAGIPKQKALRFIRANERSPRNYYSGYLGIVNMNGKTKLFVNLRCMHVLHKKLAVFSGCGVTQDSVPEREWKETEMKMKTLLNVLR
ncbi:MAG: isochorismate synthase [Chitinophagales bacterium]|nr:isochorismate synthase [Chitinophagales bacterium]